MAKIYVVQSAQSERNWIVRSVLLEGTLQKGMHLHIPLNHFLQVRGEINDVRQDAVRNEYELRILCEDEEEAELMDVLGASHEILHIR